MQESTGSQADGAAEMGGRVARLAIRSPVAICMVFVSIVLMGLIAVGRVPLMLMPKLDAPVLFIFVDYYNATPDQVLESITKPLEEALATVPGIRRMSSHSGSNGARVQVFCGMDADVPMLRVKIREKVDQIRDQLPEDLEPINILSFSTDDIPILQATLTANHDLRKDFDFLDARVKRPLERLPGVGEVELWGADRQQIEIYLRLDDIKRYRVDVGALYQSVDGANLNLTLGRIDEGDRRFSASARGALRSVDELASFPIGRRGLVLSDVADVVLDKRQRNQGRHHNGDYVVGIAIRKTAEANTVEVVDAVRTTFEKWAKDPSMNGLTVTWWHDSGKEIWNGIGELGKAGGFGTVLAVVVLFLFLRRLDTSLAVAFSIPCSVLAAIGFLYFNGNSLNTLTMMGLMLAAGMLVDNAVVVLEAILRKKEEGASPRTAATLGAGEVTLAVVAATSTTMIIFVPLMFDSESQVSIMLGHVGISIIFSLLCSLFISLTLIPLIASKLLGRVGSEPTGIGDRWPSRQGRLVRAVSTRLLGKRAQGLLGGEHRIRDAYLQAVRWNLARRYRIGLVAVPALLGGSIWALTAVVPDNSPEASAKSSVRIGYEFSENYHYAKIERDFVQPVEHFLHRNRDSLKIESTMSEYNNGSAWTRVYLDFEKIQPHEVPEIRKAISDGLPLIPGAVIELAQEGGQDSNWITASLYGEDTEELKNLARRVRTELLDTEGFDEVYTDLSGARDELRVHLRRDLARKYGISPQSVSQILSMTVRTQQMRSYKTSEGEIELWLGIDPEDMQNVNDLKAIVVGAGRDGEPVLLGNVADLRLGRVPGRIGRENKRTFTEIAAVYAGGRLEVGREAMEKILNDLPFKQGYGWSYGYWTDVQEEDAAMFLFNIFLSIVMVYFVMAALFESVLHPFAILLALPFSVVGIVLFLLITGTPFNAMAQIGTIILVGIVVNNGIVLINHINNLRRGGLSRDEAMMRGCSERLRPICMTAMTTIVGLVPLAWGDGGLMGMSYFPLARTVMGGLMASTVLTLVVLPVYYEILDDFGMWLRRTLLATAPQPQPVSGD